MLQLAESFKYTAVVKIITRRKPPIPPLSMQYPWNPPPMLTHTVYRAPLAIQVTRVAKQHHNPRMPPQSMQYPWNPPPVHTAWRKHISMCLQTRAQTLKRTRPTVAQSRGSRKEGLRKRLVNTEGRRLPFEQLCSSRNQSINRRPKVGKLRMNV